MRDKWEFQLEGFDVCAEIKDDTDPDLSYLGQYKAQPPIRERYYDRAYGRVVDPNVPCDVCKGSGVQEVCDEHKGAESGTCPDCYTADCGACDGTGRGMETTPEERHAAECWDRRSYRYIVQGGGDPEYLAADAERLEAYERQEWAMLGVVVTILKAGVELAHASLWGIESDSEESYFDEVAQDCAHEALPEAKAKIAALIADAKTVRVRRISR